MESIKEIMDALSNRVRSPILGSIVIAFAVWNWREVLTLLFGEGVFEDRLGVLHTGLIWYDYAAPVVLGLVYFWLAPRIDVYATKAVIKPNEERRAIVDGMAAKRLHNRNALKVELNEAAKLEAEAQIAKLREAEEVAALEREEARRKEQERADKKRDEDRRNEQEILDRAKADLEASKIENVELRARVEGQLEEERGKNSTDVIFDALNGTDWGGANRIDTFFSSEIEQKLFEMAAGTHLFAFDAKLIGSIHKIQVNNEIEIILLDDVEFQNGVNLLKERKILSEEGKNHYRLTSKGSLLAEMMASNPKNDSH